MRDREIFSRDPIKIEKNYMDQPETTQYGFTRILDGVLARQDHVRRDIILLHKNRLRRIRPDSDSHEAVLRLLPKVQWQEKYPPAPNSIQIQVTKACNFACSFCYANAINAGAPGSHMPFDQAKRLIDKIFTWGVPQLQWVGGETFVNKDFPRIVEYAKSLGLVQNIITNGIIPGVRLDKFASTLHAFSTIQISANAVGKDFDALVGRAMYDKFVVAIKAINNLCGTVWLSCVVTPTNAASLGEIVSLAESSGVRGITFGILAKQGRATGDRENYFRCLTVAQDALRRVYDVSTPSIEIDCHFAPTLSWPAKQAGRTDRHGAIEGQTTLYISKDGNVFPFPLLELPTLRLGNAFDEDLAQLWLTNDLLNSLREDCDDPLVCKQCDTDCSFRSRSLRYLWTGDFSGKLPCYRFKFKS